MRATVWISTVAGLAACGGGPSAAEAPPPTAAEPVDPGGGTEETEGEPIAVVAPPSDDRPGDPPPRGALAELLSYGLEPRERSVPMPTPREAVAGCPPFRGQGQPSFEWFEDCELRGTLARTPNGWLALQVDWDEGGVAALHLVEGDASARIERVGGELTPQRVEALRSALGGSTVRALDDQIGRVVVMEFSLGSYHPLVELRDSEWLLWVETTRDLDDPEWVLWLVSPDGETRHELGRRRAELGPCDGGGYWCERTQAECDANGLRAEGRLCVEPLGLRRVAIHGDELAVLGSIMVAGHGGMPGLTWFVELP